MAAVVIAITFFVFIGAPSVPLDHSSLCLEEAVHTSE